MTDNISVQMIPASLSLSSSTTRLNFIWGHSNGTAVYARNLAIRFLGHSEIQEMADNVKGRMGNRPLDVLRNMAPEYRWIR
jgi:hypothetical protein